MRSSTTLSEKPCISKLCLRQAMRSGKTSPRAAEGEVSDLGTGAIPEIVGAEWHSPPTLSPAEKTILGQAKLEQSDKLNSQTLSESSGVHCRSDKNVGTNLMTRPSMALKIHLQILLQGPVSNCNKLATDD